MKKLLIYVVLFILSCSVCNYGIKQIAVSKIDNRSPFYLCFTSIGANSLESQMDCWAKIKTTSSVQEMKETARTILNQIGCPVNNEDLKVEKSTDGNVLNYETAYKGTQILLRAETNQKSEETFYTCRLLKTSTTSAINKYRHQMDNIPGMEWHYYYLFTAEISEKLGKESQKPLLEVVMKNLNAEIYEEYSSGAATSVTGYSPVIAAEYQDTVAVGKVRYNVQAVARTTVNGSTKIYIGVPLILEEY